MTGVSTIYKFLPAAEWQVALAQGVYRGSAHDRRDGFIHFSTAGQLAETAKKYYTGVTDLVLLAVDVAALAGPGEGGLRWEPSRGGDLFPHLYGDLPLAAVKCAVAIALRPDGVPLLPPHLNP